MTAIRPTTTPLASVPPAVASRPPANPNAILSRYQPTGALPETSSQDGLAPGVQASRQMARTDLPHLQPHAQVFAQAAQKHGLPPAVLAAIASRESRGGTQLDSRGWGTGDPNGFGLMQVDRNAHTPLGGPFSAQHVDQAAGILKDMWTQVKADHPDWPPEQQLRGAIAAYNMGPEHVKTLEGMDDGTTNDDYSNDVWARAQELAPHFGGAATGPATGPTRPTQPPPGSSGNSSFEQPSTQRPNGTPPAGNLLAQGARGPEVKSLQEQLNRTGANLEVDGVYGPATEKAVRNFQQRNNLPADGIAGDMTRRALEQSAPSAPQGLLTQGAEGPAVLQLQQKLNKAGASLREDGSFGPATERAVRDFQRQNGLPTDGMVGAKTQQKLDEVVRSKGPQGPTPTRPDTGRTWTQAPSLEDVRTGKAQLREGMEGEAVRHLQQRLGLPPAQQDGQFGAGTRQAVGDFQQRSGLKVPQGMEGVVGKTTLEHLERSGSTGSTGNVTISARGQEQMRRIIDHARNNHQGGSYGDCFKFVWGYMTSSGYGKLDDWNDLPAMDGALARGLPDYLNADPARLKEAGLQRLDTGLNPPITNPHDERIPPGALIVVSPGSYGTSDPVAGDIVVKGDRPGEFINDGPAMDYGTRDTWYGNILGVYVPE